MFSGWYLSHLANIQRQDGYSSKFFRKYFKNLSTKFDKLGALVFISNKYLCQLPDI